VFYKFVWVFRCRQTPIYLLQQFQIGKEKELQLMSFIWCFGRCIKRRCSCNTFLWFHNMWIRFSFDWRLFPLRRFQSFYDCDLTTNGIGQRKFQMSVLPLQTGDQEVIKMDKEGVANTNQVKRNDQSSSHSQMLNNFHRWQRFSKSCRHSGRMTLSHG